MLYDHAALNCSLFSLINFTAFITVKLYRFVISYKYIFNKTKHVYRVVYRHNIMTIQLVAFKRFFTQLLIQTLCRMAVNEKKKSHEHRDNLFYDVIIGQLNYTLILHT